VGAEAESDIADLLELAAKAPSKKKARKQSTAPAKDDAAEPDNSASPVEEIEPYFGAAGEVAWSQAQMDPNPATQQQMPPQLPPQQQIPPQMQPQIQPQQDAYTSYAQPTPAPPVEQPWGQQLKQGAQLYAPPEVPDHVPRCPQCYVPLEGGSRFCGECGYTLPERIPICQQCSAPLEPGAKFCGECGAKFLPAPAPSAVASSLGITQEQLANVPQEALATSENFKKWVSAINPQKQQTWMVKLLKFLEQ
jgi:hypothetical protein